MAGSKNTVQLLHKCNHIISYNKILAQNKLWSEYGNSAINLLCNMRKGVTTHSTDNNDGKQYTLIGTGTTHDTI